MDMASTSLLRRLNPYCAVALDAAAALCQTRAHREITVEHWLLKLLENGEGDITVIARRYEWDLDQLWQALLGHLDSLPHSVTRRPSLSAPLLGLLQAAWLIASLEENDSTIRSVHLLQALLNQPSWLRASNAWPLLSLTSVQLERLRPLLDEQSDERPELQQQTAEAARVSSHQSGEMSQSTDAPASVNKPQTAGQAALDKFTTDVTANARAGNIDPVFGRDNEIRQMIDILSRRRKNNPILVGEPGVGKTALVEGLALRIAEGNVPASLKTVHLRTLDLGMLQAGAGVKGEFEQRLKNVIEGVQQAVEPVLLFIDEAHTIIGAGNQAGGADAANLLKPALARGELRTIAATTWSEYKQYFERDAALERRFQMVKVDEPDDQRACLMLRGLKSRYAQHHGVHIQDDAVQAAVVLSRRYLTGRQLPDKAVDLLDTASARVRMGLDTRPEALTRLQAELIALDMEQQAIEQDVTALPQTDGTRLTAIAERRATLNAELQALEQRFLAEKAIADRILSARQHPQESESLADVLAELDELQDGAPLLSLDVDVRSVATVIADWTGVPLGSLLKDEQTNLLALEQQLGERVIGQDLALTAIAQRLRAAKTGLTPENGPLGVFLLVGPSGVGKTETALALADSLFGGEQALITINLSEYQEAHTVSQLKGSPPGYVGYGQGGILTEAVRKRPYSVVLLDEVEKAHRDVLNLFYQVFDRGMMRDGEGREIDFRNTVIIMTSNLGSDELMALHAQLPEATDAQQQELLRPVLRDHFQPALLARFQTVIFRPLDAAAMRRIVAIKLEQVARRLRRHYDLDCQIDESLYDALVDACLLPDSGARNIDSLLNQQILPVLSQALLSHLAHQRKPSRVALGFDEDEGITLAFNTTEEV
ncbi:type VI secretion system ATPase TssH [Brenneria goodwinii]|uniref:ClpB protein n=1 Tax=Brenneria goodwinii TaxID=1109412 RepID=A0A0G4JYD1_9GAMM|nr:type VI secretion system ATPase TssH [Brenneria goodwinii]MCG8157532.1 type VI secretion system ATPase TssH [Brenneria goodwinii]MCG8161983.1 type VI secretion system ATPase TssH [Brenneria goodwinii]MCG8166780.1 type VI secretion system ATPase TssH [Brenneria goodwinii]MCG8171239.1 type VI secretion system ATPase TssH [Brenneria goodwinii]MCG8176322.1 type VI secretion system ATPase TssH [Brenneria goodwinii]